MQKVVVAISILFILSLAIVGNCLSQTTHHTGLADLTSLKEKPDSTIVPQENSPVNETEKFKVFPVRALNTNLDEMATCLFDNGLIVSITTKENLVNTLDKEEDKNYALHYARQKGEPQMLEEPVLFSKHLDGFYDDGTAWFSEKDSTLYFSSANGFFAGSGKSLNIYSSNLADGKWSKPFPYPWNRNKYHFAHPVISASGDQMFFSSDMPGGEGGMDIYVSIKSDSGWAAPINLGPGVNTEHNEIFPTWHKETLYFSSDRQEGEGKLDIYSSARKTQWQSATHLDAPFNSEDDDFLLLYRNEDSGYFTSNRGGNDDVYYFSRHTDAMAEKRFGLFECQGTPVRNAKIMITNEQGEIVYKTRTDARGRFEIRGVGEGEKYALKLDSSSPEIDDCAVLFLTDKDGNKKQRVEQNEDGFFVFEILPNDEIPPMALKENTDESILKIDIEGKVIDETGEEIEEGEPIYILDDNGELMALAYTTDFGSFKFSEISPNATYRLKMNEDDRSLSLVIYDGDEEITLPMSENNDAVYKRADAKNEIQILDEEDNPISIREDERFVVENIYYATDEYRLNALSMRELNRWVTILEKNPNVKIELTSHTDSRGNDEYNLTLSDRRAQEAKEYLVGKGIPTNRIVAEGKGESELLNNCDDASDCDEDEHALNRRTEIRIFAADKKQ